MFYRCMFPLPRNFCVLPQMSYARLRSIKKLPRARKSSESKLAKVNELCVLERQGRRQAPRPRPRELLPERRERELARPPELAVARQFA